jgi:hypothetical protein
MLLVIMLRPDEDGAGSDDLARDLYLIASAGLVPGSRRLFIIYQHRGAAHGDRSSISYQWHIDEGAAHGYVGRGVHGLAPHHRRWPSLYEDIGA